MKRLIIGESVQSGLPISAPICSHAPRYGEIGWIKRDEYFTLAVYQPQGFYRDESQKYFVWKEAGWIDVGVFER